MTKTLLLLVPLVTTLGINKLEHLDGQKFVYIFTGSDDGAQKLYAVASTVDYYQNFYQYYGQKNQEYEDKNSGADINFKEVIFHTDFLMPFDIRESGYQHRKDSNHSIEFFNDQIEKRYADIILTGCYF